MSKLLLSLYLTIVLFLISSILFHCKVESEKPTYIVIPVEVKLKDSNIEDLTGTYGYLHYQEPKDAKATSKLKWTSSNDELSFQIKIPRATILQTTDDTPIQASATNNTENKSKKVTFSFWLTLEYKGRTCKIPIHQRKIEVKPKFDAHQTTHSLGTIDFGNCQLLGK